MSPAAAPARLKPFKADAPENTVKRIRAVLSELDLVAQEELIPGDGPTSSVVLFLIDGDRGAPLFRTIGKGMTGAYARASAYGEMIERIQNLALYMSTTYPSEPEPGASADGPFRYYPDERPLSGAELSAGLEKLRLGGSAASLWPSDAAALGIPLLSVFSGRRVYLPFRAFQVVVGSNGMCSGNTPAEALVHGICEVFERHVLMQMFLEPFCPPVVPIDLFEGQEVHDRLRRLRAELGYEIDVMDCSRGRDLPVLGLLVRDGGERYAFHLGADPCPVTALERCLTEMFQGGAIVFKNTAESRTEAADIRASGFWRTQLHLNIVGYEGHWPPVLLSGRPDRDFTGFAHPVSVSDEEDLSHLLGVLRRLGLDLLLRDNSFTGYPSYHVYVPGVGEMTNAVDDSFAREYLKFDRHIDVLTNTRAASASRRRSTAAAIRAYSAVAPTRSFRAADYLVHYPGHPLSALPEAELIRLLLGEGERAILESLPPCFGCAPCPHTGECGHSALAGIRDRVRRSMSAGTWRACDPARFPIKVGPAEDRGDRGRAP